MSDHSSRTVKLVPVAEPEARIETATSSAEWLVAKLAEDGRSISLSVVPDLLDNSRELRAIVQLTSNSENVPKMLIQVAGQFEAAATLTPRSIVIGSDAKGTVTRSVIITTAELSRIESIDSNVVKVIARTQEHSNRHVLELTIPDKPIDVNIRIPLLLKDSKMDAVVHLPVHRISTTEPN